MRTGIAGYGVALAIVGVLGSGVAAQAATLKLVAIKKNGSAIAPTSTISVVPNDVIEAELQVSGFAATIPTGIKSFTARLDGRVGATSGPNGSILPDGWEAEPSPAYCTIDSNCRLNEVCRGLQCVQPAHNPAIGAFISLAHPRFIFSGMAFAGGAVTTSLDYLYFGVNLDANVVLDDGQPFYLGTLKLEVKGFTCGQFTLDFLKMPGNPETFFGDLNNVELVPTTVPLIMTGPTCPPLPQTSNPPNCAADAREPNTPANATRLGWASMDIQFNQAPDTATSAYRVTQSPTVFGESAPTILTITPQPNNIARINLSRIISLQRWTCIEHRASGRSRCMGAQPVDVDQNAETRAAADIAELIDYADRLLFPHPAPVDPYECDMDRSGKCGPVDILMGINMLAGSDAFTVWNNTMIAAPGGQTPVLCPSRASQ
ncbi:MAG: hypothetical protein AABZ12_10005 [Planctomycetota bacterium]